MQLFRTITFAAIVTTAFSSLAQKSDAPEVVSAQKNEAANAAEATKKLAAFLGKWTTSATFASGEKATTDLDCRWSAQG